VPLQSRVYRGTAGRSRWAEALFQQVLALNPDFPEALLELANLRTANKKSEQAAELLRRYVKSAAIPPLDITS